MPGARGRRTWWWPFCVLVLVSLAGRGAFLVADDAPVDAAAVRQYNLAVGLQNKKLYSQAAQKWAAFIQGFPKDARLPNAHLYLGICQLQENKLTEAAASFRTVLKDFPNFAARDASQYNLGLVLYNTATASKKPEDWKEAIAVFAEVNAKFPESKHAPSALFYQGECAFSSGDAAGALALYQKFVGAYPQSTLLPDVYYALGTTQQGLGQDAEAIGTFQTQVQKFPADPQANESKLRIGVSLFNQKKYAEAEQQFAPLVGIADFPLADVALIRQAQTLSAREQFPQAAGMYETVPQKFPKSKHRGAALLAAGECWFNAGKFPEAQQLLAKVTTDANEKWEEAPEAAYWLARTLFKLQKPAEALAEFDRAIAAYATSQFLPKLVFGRIDALYETPERRKETPPLFLEFSAKYLDHEWAPKGLFMAGLAALQTGDFATAQKHSAAFLADAKFGKHELFPEALFLAGESFLLAAPPDPAQSEALWRRLATEFPQHKQAPSARVRIGLALYVAKKYDAAVAHLTPLVAELKDPVLVAETQLLVGRCHSDAGRPEPAVVAYRAALAAKPDWERGDEVLLALAASLHAQKKFPEAAAELNKLNATYAKSPLRDQALYQLAEIAFEEKKFPEAAAQYQQVIAQFPKSDLAAPAQYGAGWSYYAKEDFDQAVAAFNALLINWPQSAAAARGKFMRGLAYRRQMKFELASKDLTEFLAGKPAEKDALEARYAVALCQVGLKQFEPAVATLAAIIKDKPDYAEADKVYYEMGYALAALKKPPEAAEAFRQLATKRPASPQAGESWFRVGEFHEGAKQFDEAVKAYAAGLERTKDAGLREKLQYKQAWVQYQSGKYAESLATLEAQLKEHPQGPLAAAASFLTGECLYRQDKFADALPHYAKVIAAKAADCDKALYRSGTCANQLKKWPEGQAHFAALIEQFPKYELVHEARYGLGLALQMQVKLDEARAVYEKVTIDTDTEAAAKSRYMIGEIAFAEKKYSEAIEHFVLTATGYAYEQWQGEANYEMARCFIELKMPEQARDALETVVKKFPKHARAKEAADLLATLKSP